MEFISKGYSQIFVTSEKDKQFVLDFFENDNKFEFGYLGDNTIRIIESLEDENLNLYLSYNGKFEGNLQGLIDSATLNNIHLIVKVAPSAPDGDYYNSDVITYSTFETVDTLADKVAKIIIDHVDIRGIELEYYVRDLTSPSMVLELQKLFSNIQ